MKSGSIISYEVTGNIGLKIRILWMNNSHIITSIHPTTCLTSLLQDSYVPAQIRLQGLTLNLEASTSATAASPNLICVTRWFRIRCDWQAETKRVRDFESHLYHNFESERLFVATAGHAR